MDFNKELDNRLELLESTKKFFFSRIIPLNILTLILIIISITTIFFGNIPIASILCFVSILLISISYKLAISKEWEVENYSKKINFNEAYSKVNNKIGFFAKIVTIYFGIILIIILFIAVQAQGTQILFQQDFPAQLMNLLAGIGVFSLFGTLFFGFFFALSILSKSFNYSKKLNKFKKEINRHKAELKKAGLK